MLERLLLLFLVFALLPRRVLGDDDDQVPIAGQNDKCADFCSKTYSAHTSDQPAEQSCRRGCQIFSVFGVADKMKQPMFDGEEQTNETAITVSCERECGDAYSDVIYRRACVDGCKHQTLSKNIHVVIDQNSPVFPFASKLINNAMGKFDDAKEFFNSRYGNIKNLFSGESSESDSDEDDMRSTFQRMNDKLFGILDRIFGKQKEDPLQSKEQKPILLGGPEDIGDHLPNHGQEVDTRSPIVFTGHPKHLEDETKGSSSIDNEDENGDPIIIVKMIPVSTEAILIDSTSEEKLPVPSGDVVSGETDWLACLARRTQNLSTLSRWLLCAALMMSTLCMMWLCLALLRSQRRRRRHLYTQYRNGKSDVVYFTPPPTYEKSFMPAAYVPLDKEKNGPPSPPPEYEQVLKNVDVEKQPVKMADH